MARLARIQIHPIKSFDPVVVEEVTVLPGGALQHDRQFALFDSQGKFVNGKRTPRMHLLRAKFDPAIESVHLAHAADQKTFSLVNERAELEAWLSTYFETAVTLREDRASGFPDDTEAPGPTIISSSTLREVSWWFDGMTVDETRLRFRANLEIDSVDAFWEDRLYAEPGQVVRFRIGSVEFLGTNPCLRCVVPTRSPYTGEKTPEFVRIFETHRDETLPPWATASRFDKFYRLAVNTRPASPAGGTLRLGDDVEILGIA